jgi:2'-5' RNA ligase
MTSHKSFVVADIPDPQKSRIQGIRDRLNTLTAKFPVEITLAGSSGVGPIPEGTHLHLICGEIERIARSTSAFRMEFGEISHFPETGVFYLPPKARRPFDALHESLVSSEIPFTRSQFPYNPHCTLRVGPKVEPSVSELVYSLAVPEGQMLIDSISVYSIDAGTLTVRLLHRATLRT